MHVNSFRRIALSLSGTTEQPHFEKTAFKIIGKNIFATLLESDGTANIKLPEKDQLVFCEINTSAIHPVPDKFGSKGWTTFHLDEVADEIVSDALYIAYTDVLNKKTKRNNLNHE